MSTLRTLRNLANNLDKYRAQSAEPHHATYALASAIALSGLAIAEAIRAEKGEGE